MEPRNFRLGSKLVHLNEKDIKLHIDLIQHAYDYPYKLRDYRLDVGFLLELHNYLLEEIKELQEEARK